MAVQVCVGRAGTGKTALCLNAVRDRLREGAADGNHLIFLVPEQAAFQMERALIETPELPGYSRCDVLSFRRLARRVLNEVGSDASATQRPMGPMGRLMAVKLLLKRLEPRLTVLRGAGGRGAGFLNQLTRALDEWLQEDLGPEDLRKLAEAAVAGRTSDPLSAGRLGDLHLIYSAYREFLSEGRLDPAQELAIAETFIDKIPWLRDAEVWVDGFAGFTAMERRMLIRLAGPARSMTITLLIDPASGVLGQTDLKPNRFSLFSRTERTFVTLREAMQAAGIEWLPIQRLASERPPRFAASELAGLERNLFRAVGVRGPEGQAAASAEAGGLLGGAAFPIRLLAVANRRVEVEAAVGEVQRLVRSSGGRLRYRDIAIIVRDLGPYHELLSAALGAHGIPFFIDRRRSTAHHPLVELLRLLPALVHRDFQGDDVRLLLKTGLVPLDDVAADRLENYVVAHGLVGAPAWLGPAEWTYRRLFTGHDPDAELTEPEQVALDEINAYRRRLVEPLRDWATFVAAGAAATGREWVQQLLGVLERLGVAATLERWAEQAIDAGRADEADVHRQVWRDAKALLDDFVDALGDVPITAGEFSGVLDAALSEFTLGLAPPTLDQVLVGSIERSRHPDLAAVLLLGFNDGLFPSTPAEDVILSDAEREQIEARRPPVGVTRRQRILDEKMLAYIALTRPSRSLWVSYALADDAGKPLRASPFVHDLRAAVPGLSVEQIDDAVAKREVWPIGRVRDLAARLALEFGSRPESAEKDDPGVRGRWNALYERARRDEAYAHDMAAVLASLAYRNEPQLMPGDAAGLYAGPIHFSASRIETFAACSFRHFARYALRLEPRVEFAIEVLDFGLLHHKVLEEFFAELIEGGKGLAELEPAEIAERLTRLGKQWVARLADEAVLNDARNAFLLDRSNRHLKDALARQRLMARLGAFKPRAVEWAFGLPGGRGGGPTAGPLELRTPGGRRISVVGKIDRIDLLELERECLGVVLDYKRSAGKRMALWKVYNGLDVQLLTYLLTLVQRGETLAGRPIRPIGAFYVPLVSMRRLVSHPSDASDIGESIQASLKPRGMLEFEAAGQLDRTLEPGRGSDAYAVKLNVDGALGYAKWSDAYPAADLARVMAFARHKIGELADAILDGDIAVRPYRAGTQMPCAYCEFRSVCRFDFDVNEVREVHGRDRDAVLEDMGRVAGEGGP